MSYQFEFEKKSLLALGIGELLLGVALFFAGFFTEMLIARQARPIAIVRTASSPPSPATAASTAEQTPSSKTPPLPPAAVSVLTPSAQSGSATALQLAVQVGAFAEPAQAKHMVEQLQKQGFSPIISSQPGAGSQQVSIVEVGPFSAWEQASHVAQLIGRSLGVRPAIRPVL